MQAQPIFEQASLHHCLGPDTCGQRLLNSTLIKSKTLSDSHLRTSRETQEFLVMSLPHRLSVHTGKLSFCGVIYLIFATEVVGFGYILKSTIPRRVLTPCSVEGKTIKFTS